MTCATVRAEAPGESRGSLAWEHVELGPAESKPEPIPPVGHQFALCIGMNWPYGHAGFDEIDYARADAKSLGAVFKALGYETTVMTDDGPSELTPTCENLKTKLLAFARQARSPDDKLVISYAGHGNIVNGQSALIPLDYDEHHPNPLMVSDVLDCLDDKKCLSRNKLLLLDACHSGKEISARFLQPFESQRSMWVFSGCDKMQGCIEDGKLKHGHFTQALIWGLVGRSFNPQGTRAADAEPDAECHGEAFPDEPNLVPTELATYVGRIFKENQWNGPSESGPGSQDEFSPGQNPGIFGGEDVTAPMILAHRDLTDPSPHSGEDQQSIADILQDAKDAYAAGDYKRVIDHATRVLHRESANPEALALRALGNLHATFTKQADQDAEAALNSDPHQAAAWQVRGMCAAEKGDKKSALYDLRMASKIVAENQVKWSFLSDGGDAARRLLEIGQLTPDATEAFKAFQDAAETQGASQQTIGVAAALVGWGYEHDVGVPQDYVQAMVWYRKAADAGNADGMNNVGFLYEFENAQGVPQDHVQAMAWFRKAADAGAATGMNNIGVLYDCGHGVAQDYAQAMTWYRKAADAGYATAMCNIGALYGNGRGVPQDYAQAVAWFRKAADAGEAHAMFNIGILYAHGRGVPQDYVQALAWYRKAADAGVAQGMNNVGALYAHGQGVPQDYVQAMAWYQKAANAGAAFAMKNIGGLYELGNGVPQDYAQAMTSYLKAADAGDATGMSNIGGLYELGHGVPQDCAQAMAWYRRAAEAGNTGAMHNIGVMYANGRGVPQDYVQAMAWCRRAADGGNADAMNDIGYLYGSGHGVQQDYAQAMVWYRKAADAGAAIAMKNIGVLYANGQSVPQDYVQAMVWYRKGADAGNADAMNDIGYMYDEGRGVPQDYAQAMAWYQRAAAAGESRSMFHIAELYSNGRGVNKDETQARSWYLKAADAGDDDAKKWLAANRGK